MQIPVVKSPLSIIALFVALIEAFLAYPVTQLQGTERLIIVVFMTCFPFFVASAFFYILWHKPIALYNPQEIPVGLQDRYQPEIVKATALELKLSEAQEQIMNLTAAVTSNLPTLTSTTPGVNIPLTESDLRVIESEIVNRISEETVTEKTINQAKSEIEKQRKQSKKQSAVTIQKEIAKFRSWLVHLEFKNLPEVPNIILEPPELLNVYADQESRDLHVGSSLVEEYVGIDHTYFSSFLSSLGLEYQGENAALIIGLSDYYACSFHENPLFGEVLAKAFAKVSKIEMRWIRNLEEFVKLNQVKKEDVYSMSVVWSGACWELRKLYGNELVDTAIRATVEKLSNKNTLRSASKLVENELVTVKGQPKEDIRKVFEKRGI